MVSLKKLMAKFANYCINPTIKDDTLEAELTAILGDISA